MEKNVYLAIIKPHISNQSLHMIEICSQIKMTGFASEVFLVRFHHTFLICNHWFNWGGGRTKSKYLYLILFFIVRNELKSSVKHLPVCSLKYSVLPRYILPLRTVFQICLNFYGTIYIRLSTQCTKRLYTGWNRPPHIMLHMMLHIRFT